MDRNIIAYPKNRPLSFDNLYNNTEDFKSRVLKLIPAEIVAAYLTLKGLIDSAGASPDIKELIYWLVFVLLLVLTPIFYRKVTGISSGKQLLVTTLAYVVWVFSVGGPLGNWLITQGIFTVSDQSLVASVSLILFTLTSPLLFMPKASTQAGVV